MSGAAPAAERPVRVLMVSIDAALITRTITNSRERHEAYAREAGAVRTVVCNLRSRGRLEPFRSASADLAATPTNSRTFLHYLRDGYRAGLSLAAACPPHVLTSQDPFLTALVALRLRRRLRLPWIVQVHGPFLENRRFAGESLLHALLQRLARLTVRRADAVRVVSRAEREACLRLGVGPERVFVVHTPANLGRFAAAVPPEGVAAWRRRLDLAPGDPVVLWVGRPVPFKNLPLLLETWPRVLAAHPRARLILAGDMSGTPYPEEVRRRGLEATVRVPGPVPHEDLPPLFRLASVYVHPSYYEGLGLVMLEAGASGLPVVAAASDGAREIVRDGETGVLTPLAGGPADAVAFAEAVAGLLADPPRARALGAAARAHVAAAFDEAAVVAELAAMWRQVAAGAPPARRRPA